jgi:hypothetical protein
VLGTTGVLCLGVWAIASFILSLCFTCNLRAILLMPEYEGFVDTACDVVEHNLVRNNFALKLLTNEKQGSTGLPLSYSY